MANLQLQQNKKYHILYKTTNLLNNKFYVGAHSTNHLDDNYLGSGYNIVSAIKKYGRENFSKEIILILDDPESMFLIESYIVTYEFIKNEKVYNIVTGGFGGTNRGSLKLKHLHHPITKKRCAVHQDAVQKMLNEGWVLGRNMSSTTGRIWIHKESSKKMISSEKLNFYIKRGWTQGLSKSPTRGKKWIYNTKTSKYSLCDIENIPKMLLEGWIMKKWAPFTKGTIQNKIICPHCGKSGGKSAMKRFHFENCLSVSNHKNKFQQRKISCPHCNKLGGISNMKRHHFDNCKFLQK